MIQVIAKENYSEWDKFVTSSPQGSLFHTIEWNQMLCQTENEAQGFMPLASLDENEILAGLIVRYRLESGRKAADLSHFGYNNPVFSTKLNYANRCHTYRNFSILTDLVNEIVKEFKTVRLEQSPDIWDIRPFRYQSWNITTTYTHLLKENDHSIAWDKIDPDLKRGIVNADRSFDFKVDNDGEYVQQFTKSFRDNEKLLKRIEWLKNKGHGRLFVVTDKKSNVVCTALVILSQMNRTAYLWKTIFNQKSSINEFLPFMYWQCYSNLAEGYSCLDLGASSHIDTSRIKDKLGAALNPHYFVTYQKH